MTNLKTLTSLTLEGENTRYISLVKNPVLHAHSKHIEVHHCYVWEKLEEKHFSLLYVPMGENVANLFTKRLDKTKHFKNTL